MTLQFWRRQKTKETVTSEFSIPRHRSVNIINDFEILKTPLGRIGLISGRQETGTPNVRSPHPMRKIDSRIIRKQGGDHRSGFVSVDTWLHRYFADRYHLKGSVQEKSTWIGYLQCYSDHFGYCSWRMRFITYESSGQTARISLVFDEHF